MVFWILFIGGQLVVRWPGRPRAQEPCSTALLLCHHLQRREDAGISSPPGSLNLSRAVGVATGGSYPAWGNSQNLRGGARHCFWALLGWCNRLVCATTLHPQPTVPSVPDSLLSPSSCLQHVGERVQRRLSLSGPLSTP